MREHRRNCVGCGYCNLGCAYGRKLSMLDTVLPWAQRTTSLARVRIVSECEVERLRQRSPAIPSASSTRAPRSPDGRVITIKRGDLRRCRRVPSPPATSCCGAASVAGCPSGSACQFNMGSPVTAQFDQVLNAYDGLQISHYGKPVDGNRGFVMRDLVEPAGHPSGQHAGLVRGPLRQHAELSTHLMAIGDPRRHRQSNALGHQGAYWRPGHRLHAEAGRSPEARRRDGAGWASCSSTRARSACSCNTWGNDVFTHPQPALGSCERIASDPSYLTLGTGHPHGRQRRLSRDPARGVVDPGLQGPRLRQPAMSATRACSRPVADRQPAADRDVAGPLRRHSGSARACTRSRLLRVVGVLLVYAALFFVIIRALRASASSRWNGKTCAGDRRRRGPYRPSSGTTCSFKFRG